MTDRIALLLDLDGTLLDTAPDMGGALNRLLVEEGRTELPPQVIRPVVSHGAARLVQLGFPESAGDEFERLRKRFLALYAQYLAIDSCLFPGWHAVLDELERLGIPWGVVTNKPAWLTDPLLPQLGLGARARCVVSGDTVAERKPHPLPLLHAARLIGIDPARCVYAGDAERDIQAGRAAGMRTVIAAYGYIAAGDDLAGWNADGVVEHPVGLLDWVRTAADTGASAA